jgi:hypothetical protein
MLDNLGVFSRFILIVSVFIVFLFSGCTLKNDEGQVLNKEKSSVEIANLSYPIVDVLNIESKSIIPEITLSGTIIAHKEITIASEVTGQVANVFKKKGMWFLVVRS